MAVARDARVQQLGAMDRQRELLERERRAATRLARLQALTASLSEAVSAHDVARVAAEHARGAIGARDAAVWIRRDDDTVELLYAIDLAPEQRAIVASIPAGARTPVHDTLRQREPVCVLSRAELQAHYPELFTPSSGTEAIVCVPMEVKAQCIGALSLSFDSAAPLTAEDRSFLLVAARLAAQALERARLYEAERIARAEAVAASERAAFLSEASALLSSSLQYQETLASVARLAVPRVADWCAVDLAEDLACRRGPVVVAHADPHKVELAHELGRRYPPDPDASKGPAAVVRSGRPELYPDIEDAVLVELTQGPAHLRVALELGLRSAMIVPMLARGRTLGAITLVSAESGRRFGPADLEMAQHLARRAALAIDNASLYEQAQQAARAREDVVAVVSHDLKNPLNAILMSSELLRRSADAPERVRHHADAIERSVNRMRNLVRDLLDLARLEAGRFTLDRQPSDVGALAADAVAVLQPLAVAKRLALVAEVAPASGVRVLCDRERMMQVLSNLLGNAIAFTPSDGQVTVRARPTGSSVLFAVSDTGPGIPQDEQRLIFDRFWKSRSSGQGTGLGLSIAKGIVEAHGGRIWVESHPQQGATLLFTLPLASGPG